MRQDVSRQKVKKKKMANFISIFRIFVMFYAAYLIYACEGNATAYVWALILTIIAFSLDGVDGYVARKFNETYKVSFRLLTNRLNFNLFVFFLY